MFGCAHVEAQHGTGRPLLLYLIYVEPFEQVFPSLEIRLERRDEQRLAEPPGAAQEDVVAKVYHVPDILGLVDIEHVILSDFLKGLYAHGQSFQLLRFHILKY